MHGEGGCLRLSERGPPHLRNQCPDCATGEVAQPSPSPSLSLVTFRHCWHPSQGSLPRAWALMALASSETSRLESKCLSSRSTRPTLPIKNPLQPFPTMTLFLSTLTLTFPSPFLLMPGTYFQECMCSHLR